MYAKKKPAQKKRTAMVTKPVVVDSGHRILFGSTPDGSFINYYGARPKLRRALAASIPVPALKKA